MLKNKQVITKRYYSAVYLLLFLVRCGEVKEGIIPLDDLVLGEAVKVSGKKLINHSLGMQRMAYPSARADTIIIAVHGYDSRGYEWIYPLITMAKTGKRTFFYRWDWTDCPLEAAQDLKAAIAEIVSQFSEVRHLLIFGHSYGGVIVTALAAQGWDGLSADFHAIAAPLAGHPRLVLMCPGYPDLVPAKAEFLTQWRTQHLQDGAFRDLTQDPQNVAIQGSVIITLPDSTDGYRLGHNRSISWVVDTYFERQK